MKKLIAVLIAFMVVSAYSFKGSDNDISLARVIQDHGFFIFVDAQPVQPYDFIISVKVRDDSKDFKEMKKKIFQIAKRKEKKEKVDADGIIIHMDTRTADIIKFK